MLVCSITFETNNISYEMSLKISLLFLTKIFFAHVQGILVPMASAIRLSYNNYYKVEDANHLTICKPPTRDHPSYSILLECLKTFMKVNNIDFTSWMLYVHIILLQHYIISCKLHAIFVRVISSII
jgi:hypothetical protein